MAGLQNEYDHSAVNVDRGNQLHQQTEQIQANNQPTTSGETGEVGVVLALFAAAAFIAFPLIRAVWRRAKFWPSQAWQHFLSMLRDIRNATR